MERCALNAHSHLIALQLGLGDRRQHTLLSDPESKPWGLHEFTAADPDGNRFRVFYDFATPEREGAKATAP